MKSLAELAKLREQMRGEISLRHDSASDTRVVVCMATCGIAAGAKPVLYAFVEEIGRSQLENIMVTQSGCIGQCQMEPIVEVSVPGKDKITYVKITPEKAVRIVAEHLKGGNPVVEYTAGAAQ